MIKNVVEALPSLKKQTINGITVHITEDTTVSLVSKENMEKLLEINNLTFNDFESTRVIFSTKEDGISYLLSNTSRIAICSDRLKYVTIWDEKINNSNLLVWKNFEGISEEPSFVLYKLPDDYFLMFGIVIIPPETFDEKEFQRILGKVGLSYPLEAES